MVETEEKRGNTVENGSKAWKKTAKTVENLGKVWETPKKDWRSGWIRGLEEFLMMVCSELLGILECEDDLVPFSCLWFPYV